MSILIRGMALPKNCTGCPICCGLPYQHRDAKGRRPDCPLVEVNETLFSAENTRRFLMENPSKGETE